MSDQNTDQTTDHAEDQAPEDQATPEQPDTPQDADQDTEDAKAPKDVNEARKYRKRAQEAEAARDLAQAQLHNLRHQLVTEEASAHHRVNPELFTAAGINIDTLFTEDGALDHNKVTDTCAEIREKFGIPEQKKYRDNPLQGSPARDRDAASWADAFLQQNGH